MPGEGSTAVPALGGLPAPWLGSAGAEPTDPAPESPEPGAAPPEPGDEPGVDGAAVPVFPGSAVGGGLAGGVDCAVGEPVGEMLLLTGVSGLCDLEGPAPGPGSADTAPEEEGGAASGAPVHPTTHVLNIRQAAAIAVVLCSPSRARMTAHAPVRPPVLKR